MGYEPPMVATPYDDDIVVVSNCGDTPPSGCQPKPPNPILNAQPPLQPPNHNEYTTSSHDPHSTLFGYHENEGGVTSMEPDRDLAIEQHACELFASGNTDASWAEEMEMEMAFEPQGEYMVSSYSPPPALPSPAPWYPPQPPSLHHAHQQMRHLPPHRWYNPQEPEYMPRSAPHHPRTRPTLRQAPVLKRDETRLKPWTRRLKPQRTTAVRAPCTP
jgi:hypothetical protein